MLENRIETGSLTATGVTINGDWLTTRPSDWRGIAAAGSSLVAVSFLQNSKDISWCKSERSRPEGQEVQLLLGWFDNIGLDVSVSFGIAASRRSRTRLPNVSYRPVIEKKAEFVTGELSCFATVHGDPVIDCWVLFLARQDVSVGRKGLWHLRRDRREGVKEPLRSVLSYGRTGTFQAA
jgi:hypothetical protein